MFKKLNICKGFKQEELKKAYFFKIASTEYLPLPSKNSAQYDSKYSNAGSIVPRSSLM